MHIALVTQFYWPFDRGGSGYSVRELAEGLVVRGHRVTVIAQAGGAQDERCIHNDVEIIYISRGNRFSRHAALDDRSFVRRVAGQLYPELHPSMMREMGKYLSELQPDIVHTNVLAHVSTRIWDLAQSLGIRVVHTIRDYYLICFRGAMIRGEQSCNPVCLECRACVWRRENGRHLDAVVGGSNFVLQRHLDLGHFGTVERKRAIAIGFPAAPDEIRDRMLNRPFSAKLKIGYLGRLHRSKGVALLLDAVRNLPAEEFELHIGGAGANEYVQGLKQRISGWDVKFHGQVEPDEFLVGIDVLVLPSLFDEPFGRVIIEANRLAIPVVSARRGGAQELVRDGFNGWLFEPTEKTELPAILERLCHDGIPLEIRVNSLASADEYSRVRTIDQYESLYSEVCGLDQVISATGSDR